MSTAYGACGPNDFDVPWNELRRRMKAHWMTMGGPHPRGFGPGPGWQFGPAWPGMWQGKGMGGPGGRRAGRGDVRMAILALLAAGPRHGYQIMADIAERSGGVWKPSPGSVYPVLSALQDEGLVDDEKVEGKRVFSLTASGRQYTEANASALSEVFSQFTRASEDTEQPDVRALLAGLAGATIQVVANGTSDQIAAAVEILERTRRDLYGLLASESATDAS